MLYFDFSLFNQSVCIKRIYTRNFRCSTKEAVILLLSWSTMYIAFPECIVSWICFFYFALPPISQSAYAKINCFLHFRCFAKEAVLLLCSWSTLYIAFIKCKVSWFYFFYFNLLLLTESAYVKANFCWNFIQRTQTSLRRLQDVLKRSRRLTTKQDVVTTSAKRRQIYNVLKMSDLHHLEDVHFTTSWRHLIYVILKKS